MLLECFEASCPFTSYPLVVVTFEELWKGSLEVVCGCRSSKTGDECASDRDQSGSSGLMHPGTLTSLQPQTATAPQCMHAHSMRVRSHQDGPTHSPLSESLCTPR